MRSASTRFDVSGGEGGEGGVDDVDDDAGAASVGTGACSATMSSTVHMSITALQGHRIATLSERRETASRP
jgi:hypothetical protein